MRPPPRRHWKLERPVVSSYWPVKGKVGTRVVIKGRNFPKTTELVFAGQTLRGAGVGRISISVPRDLVGERSRAPRSVGSLGGGRTSRRPVSVPRGLG
ncbi:MAG: hypothetical protein LOX97_05670, partial [Sphingomonas sp.]|nr:hypothetical protein [Sphingomonas sp.]